MPRKIEYLALEGGGGKGAVYLELVKILESQGMIGDIKTYSGSSAGAITALLMASGYTSNELEAITFGQDDEVHFDDMIIGDLLLRNRPFYRAVIELENCVEYAELSLPFERKELYENEKRRINFAAELAKYTPLNVLFGPLFKYLIAPSTKNKIDDILADDELFSNMICNTLYLGAPNLGKSVILLIRKLLNRKLRSDGSRYIHQTFGAPSPGAYLTSYIYNAELNKFSLSDTETQAYGSFEKSSKTMGISRQIKENLENGLAPATDGSVTLYNDPGLNVTFSDFFDAFGVSLYLTGTNLVDGKTYIFSYETTPNFPIVPAVAISMNLPIWPPIFVSYESNGIDYTGWYVDGGLLNNIPTKVFSNEPSIREKSKLERSHFNWILPDNVASVIIDPPSRYLKGYPDVKNLINWINIPMSLSTALESEKNKDTLYLLSNGLSTFNFNPSISDYNISKDANIKIIKAFIGTK